MNTVLKELLSKSKHKATGKQVEALQRKLGYMLPPPLVEMVLYIDQGHLNNVCCFSVRRQCFSFHAIQKSHYQFVGTDINSAYRDYFHEVFPGVVPIGAEGNGDSICLDYRVSPERPVVLKHDHEIGYRSDFPFYYLARDFSELLDRADPARRAHYLTADDAITQEALDALLGYHDQLSIEHRAHDLKYGR